MLEKIEMTIGSRERDIGGFSVRRLLPYATHRMVGPVIFFDHMGPAQFEPGQGMDVRPHPHINLATVTYLFDGQIRHRDSLGSDQLISPGDINWMTAGRGIVHSERTPAELRESGGRTHGIQLWVALPTEHEEIDPSFVHHPSRVLPEFEVDNVHLKLLLGSAFDRTSPVKIHSDLFYLEAVMPKGSRFTLPVQGREAAAYVVEGSVRISDQHIPQYSMAVGRTGCDLDFEALESSRVMLIGGQPVGERFIYWNFVSSSKERLEAVKAEWGEGPHLDSDRFKPIPNDDKEFIPLPESPASNANPKGTIM